MCNLKKNANTKIYFKPLPKLKNINRELKIILNCKDHNPTQPKRDRNSHQLLPFKAVKNKIKHSNIKIVT